MRTVTLFITALLVALCALAMSSERAHAGIIIVLGKLDEGAKQAKTGATLPGEHTMTTTTNGTTSTCSPEPLADKAAVPSSCGVRMDPTTGLPMGYDCRPIGRGVYYCEAQGAGAGPDAGGGGASADGWDDIDDAEMTDAEDELQVMGCAGGAGASGFMGIFAAFGALAVMVRARRGR